MLIILSNPGNTTHCDVTIGYIYSHIPAGRVDNIINLKQLLTICNNLLIIAFNKSECNVQFLLVFIVVSPGTFSILCFFYLQI